MEEKNETISMLTQRTDWDHRAEAHLGLDLGLASKGQGHSDLTRTI